MLSHSVRVKQNQHGKGTVYMLFHMLSHPWMHCNSVMASLEACAAMHFKCKCLFHAPYKSEVQ